MSNVLDEIARSAMRDDIPEFRAGDSVKVHVKVCLLYTSPSPRD